MARSFNIAGPNVPAWHYTLPILERLPEVHQLVAERAWFVVHAPRQSGKTTAMRALASALTGSGRYAAVHATCEAGAPFGADPLLATEAVVRSVVRSARQSLPEGLRPPEFQPDPHNPELLATCLSAWCAGCLLPVVLLLDEIDALQDDALLSVLRQLRAIFPERAEGRAPYTVALIGLRDLRDYKVRGPEGPNPGACHGVAALRAARPPTTIPALPILDVPSGTPAVAALDSPPDGRTSLDDSLRDTLPGTAPLFNVTARSLTLSTFTPEEVGALYGQHTAETGQAFTPAAIERAWALTRGQPWLVNALAREALARLEPGVPVGVAVTATHTATIDEGHIEAAKERLVQARSTHLESLAHKLTEPRVRAVIEPILTGERGAPTHPADVDYCVELGLLERRGHEGLVVANPIYREVLPRELAVAASDAIGALPARTWALPDGRLDLEGLLRAFVDFWKKDGEWMVRDQQWPEAAHQLLLMAFLQRVVNGGGTIEREYGLGRGRIDLLVRWALRPGPGGARMEEDRHALEVKVWRDGSHDHPVTQGLAQLDGYLDRLGLAEGTLVVFDARAAAPSGKRWRERGHFSVETTPSGRTVRLLVA